MTNGTCSQTFLITGCSRLFLYLNL